MKPRTGPTRNRSPLALVLGVLVVGVWSLADVSVASASLLLSPSVLGGQMDRTIESHPAAKANDSGSQLDIQFGDGRMTAPAHAGSGSDGPGGPAAMNSPHSEAPPAYTGSIFHANSLSLPEPLPGYRPRPT